MVLQVNAFTGIYEKESIVNARDNRLHITGKRRQERLKKRIMECILEIAFDRNEFARYFSLLVFSVIYKE
jgi:hypothetical protein